MPTEPLPRASRYTAPDEHLAEYHQALRVAPEVWRGLLVVLLFVGAVFVAIRVAFMADTATGGGQATALTPGGLLAYNLLVAAFIPIAMFLQWAMFKVRPGWLSSVTGRFRWRWMGRLAGVIVPVWLVFVGLIYLLRPAGPLQLDGTTLALAAVVILTTPLQAAAEEYAFRGLLQRSAGSWVRGSNAAFVLSTAITAVPFALLHQSGDPWAVAYYVVSGVGLSLAVRYSGGLEASVLMHAVNNVLFLLLPVLTGKADDLLDRSSGAGNGIGGPVLLIPTALMLAVPFLIRTLARRHGVAVRAALPPTLLRKARSSV